MDKFRSISSKVVPLPLKDVDTDMIIPAVFLTSVSREGYGENLFRRLRDADPNFILNRPEYQGSQILVTGENFGCGSSREHAVWALVGWGFRVVIAKSFADIFSGNSAKNGLLLVTLPPETVDEILAEASAGAFNVTVDLERQTVELPDGETLHFDYDPFRKHCLLEGLDDLDYLLSRSDRIEAWRKQRDAHLYYSTTQANRD